VKRRSRAEAGRRTRAIRISFYSPEMKRASRPAASTWKAACARAVAQKEFRSALSKRKSTWRVARFAGWRRSSDGTTPEFGLVSPLEFVPLLEESGQIVEVGRWVFEQAVADTNRWKSLGLEVPRVAVNVFGGTAAASQFCVATVLGALGPLLRSTRPASTWRSPRP